MSMHTPPTPQSTPQSPFSPEASSYGAPVRHGSPWWLWVLTIGLLGTVVWMQRPEAADPVDAQLAAAGMDKIAPPHVDGLVIMGKLLFAARGAPPPYEPMVQQFIDQSAGWEAKSAGTLGSPVGVSAKNPPKERKEPMPASERLRATVLAGEHLGPVEIDWRLADIERTLDKASPLWSDVALMRTLYGAHPPSAPSAAQDVKKDGEDADAKDGAAGKARAELSADPVPLTSEVLAGIDPDAKKGFQDRHGWFADLALTRGDDKAPVRESAARDGGLMVALLLVVGLVVCLAGLAGFVLLIIAAVMFFGGTLRAGFPRPRPETEWPNGEVDRVSGFGSRVSGDSDGVFGAGRAAFVAPETRHPIPETRSSSVWLETVAVFLGGFLALKLVSEGFASAFPKQGWVVWVSLLGQWTLISAIFWPVVRGMSFQRWRGEIGWHSGRGVFREIGCGIMGYLACLPVYFGMAMVVVIVSMIISALTGSDPVTPADNKVLDLVEGGGVLALVCVYLLATIWAPLVEESIFRGAMFRHLRRRVPLVLAALGSCMVFAVLHGYVIAGLFMVGTLGFWFALMREWRGSLIAPAVAHAIHNGVVLAVLITLVRLGSV